MSDVLSSRYNGILVPVRTSFGLRRRAGKRRMYQRKVDVDMLNVVKSVLADVSSVSPSSEQRMDYGLGESLYSVRWTMGLARVYIV